MLTSLGLIFLLGLLMAAICQKIHLPRIIGMLFTGIILGPYVLNLLDVSILNISSQLRQIALIIILLKAGLSLDLKDLKKVGRSAVMLSCVPATCELLAFVIFAPMILNIDRVDAAVMGAVLAAVSPAVVVPRMVHLMENGYGTEKSIPQMILAGASCDDIYVIVLFSAFVGMAQGGHVNALDFANIPVSILTGVLFGALVGWLLRQLFELLYRKGSYVRNSMKVIIIMGLSFLLMALETMLKGKVAFSGLLAVVSMACALKMRTPKEVTGRLSAKFGKLWLAAEVVLFVLVGVAWAAINVNSYPMIVEMSKGSDIGKFTGTYYTFSMAAQILTPVLSGFLLEKVSYRTLFPYAFVFSVLAFITMMQVHHGDTRPDKKASVLEHFDVDD